MAANDELDQLAHAQIDTIDDEILAKVAELWDRIDPPPDGLAERVAFGVTLEALHAEIARMEVVPDLAGVRAEPTTDFRTVTFSSDSMSIMITVSPVSADRVRIDGWLVPAGRDLDARFVDVELRSPDGNLHGPADADGRFVFATVPRGLAQFVISWDDTAGSATSGAGGVRQVVTPTVEI